MVSYKNLIPIATNLFVRGRKLNISTVYVTQVYFQVPKDDTLKCKNSFILKIPDKQWLHHIVFTRSSDVYCEDFAKKKYAAKLYFCLVFDTNLLSDNRLRFIKNLLETI